MSAVRIGVDIGGTKVDAVVLDSAGEVAARQRVQVRKGDDGVVASARDAVAQACAQAGVAPGDAGHIGVGVPGAVTAGVVRHALNLGVVELDLAAALEDAWQVPVQVENDVNAAAIGAWHLLGDGRTSVAYLNVGTGLAAGIILDGRLWRGARGAAGEIGHIGIDPAGPVGADGLRGGLETYASGSGIALQWDRRGEAAVDVLRAAQEGDARAQQIRHHLVEGVAHAARVLILTLDVEHVMLGGGLTGMGDALVDGVRGVIRDWERDSTFLASLEIGTRLSLVPGDQPVAAIGSAMLEVDHG